VKALPRLVVLLLLLAIGWGVKWLLFDWPFRYSVPGSFRVIHGAVLLGGWSAVVWSVLRRMGGTISPGILPLVLVGLLADRLLLSGFIGAMNRGLAGRLAPSQGMSETVEIAYGAGIFTSLGGLILLGGLGAMAFLAWTWDMNWAKACMAAGGTGGIATGSAVALGFALEKLHWKGCPIEEVLHVLVLLFELAWFSWWANRIRNRLRDGKA